MAHTPDAGAIASRLSRLCPEIVDDAGPVYAAVNAAEDPISRGKEILYLTENRGAFLKKCPGTREYTCCDYQILHIGTFCNMDCAYCILQSYFHPPVLQYFLNQADLFAELDDRLDMPGIHRIGTGEFTDSLIWEIYSDLSTRLVSRFAQQDRAVLELKTKTTAIEALKGPDHGRKTIIAFSVNTERVIRSEERYTASLDARLAAAQRVQSRGYPIAFHFDPIILYPGCHEEYEAVIQKIFSHISPENIVWISMGAFRFMPALKTIIEKRFPHSKIAYGEFITGLDNKMRYFKPLRIEIFEKMARQIKEIAPEVTAYLCMEDDEVWEKAFGFLPQSRGGLGAMLDRAAVRVCGLSP